MHRGQDWAKHGHKGAEARTPESYQRAAQKMTGSKNPAWKGGVTYVSHRGNYKRTKCVRCPPEYRSMARSNGYVAEHRLLVARELGRMLTRTEVVHHVNHDSQDNRLVNLMLFASNRDHKLFEHHGAPAPIWCGSAHESSVSTTPAPSGA